MGLFSRNKGGDLWEVAEKEKTALDRLREEIGEIAARVRGSFSRFVGHGSAGVSSRLITLGEVVIEFSATTRGRIITATLALTLAWWLL